jgi:hypothetical protein
VDDKVVLKLDTDYLNRIHQRKLHLEALIKKNDEECYLYVTYDPKQLKNFTNNPNYSIQAYAYIPLGIDEGITMRLFVDNHNSIKDFTMQYHKIESKHGLRERINIRSDYGHNKPGFIDPHIDIEIYDLINLNEQKKPTKIYDQDIHQNDPFLHYEKTINLILMQTEKLVDPTIGAKYWLSPSNIFPEFIAFIYSKWHTAKLKDSLKTSLTVVSRIVNARILNYTNQKIVIDYNLFCKIVEDTITEILEKENELGVDIEVIIQYNSLYHYLPFYFFIPTHLPGIAYDIRLTKNDKEEKNELYGSIIQIKNGKYSIKKLPKDNLLNYKNRFYS